MVPGYEIVGIVTEVGNKVTKCKVGDKVGVGCMVGLGACHSCDSCKNHLENYCSKMILTYGAINSDETVTYGGYSDSMVANGALHREDPRQHAIRCRCSTSMCWNYRLQPNEILWT